MHMKPMTPLQTAIIGSLKPPTPLLAPEQQPLKPVAPLRPKNTPKAPISGPQRRRRFQLAHITGLQRRQGFQSDASRHEQRCHRFQTTAPHAVTSPTSVKGTGGTGGARLRCPWATAGPGRAHLQHSAASAARVEGAGGTGGARLRRPWAAAALAEQRADAPSHTPADQAPPVWRAPEGPEGAGGLRGVAPNAVRQPSLAGGRALRRPEHQRHHKRHDNTAPRQGTRTYKKPTSGSDVGLWWS